VKPRRPPEQTSPVLLAGSGLFVAASLLLAAAGSAIGAGVRVTPVLGGVVKTPRFEPAAVSFVSPLKGWALGRGACSACAAVGATSDGGRHWAVLPAPPVLLWYYKGDSSETDRRAVRDLAFADSTNGYLYAPGLLTTHDGGRSWRRQSLPPVSQLSLGRGYAFALTHSGSTGRAALWRTPIGRDRWSRLPLPAAAAAPASDKELARSFSLQLSVGGVTLVLLQPGFNGPSSFPHPAGRLWASNDSGASWRSARVPCSKADGRAAVSAIAFHNPRTWLLDCFDNRQSSQAQNTEHHLYRSIDAGRTWKRVSDPTRHNMPAMLADNGNGHTLFATVGGGGDALVGSFDVDRHWQLLFHSGGGFFGWADLQFITRETALVVGPTHYAPEHLYRTDDGGRTWRILRVG
jgi:photosystem II stability/assembly factor-like uncharacterized protein